MGIKRFEADSYRYENVRDFYNWEQRILAGTPRMKIDGDAIQRISDALSIYENLLEGLADHLHRNIFAKDIKIIRNVSETSRYPVQQKDSHASIDAFIHSENFVSTGGISQNLSSQEILDPQVQKMLEDIFDIYTRISHLLFWRETLALPSRLVALMRATFLVKNMDLAKEIKSQMKIITDSVSLLTIKGEGLILPVAMRNYLGHAFLEILKNSLIAAQQSNRPMNITVELIRKENKAVIELRDNAGGIEPDNFDKVFYIGYSLSKDVLEGGNRVRGNGLGWAIVRRTINRHGGILEVENIPSVGVKTIITLPLDICSKDGGARER